METENNLLHGKHILCISGHVTNWDIDFEYMKNNFCGQVVSEIADLNCPDIIIYLCGDISSCNMINLNNTINVIDEYSYNYEAFIDSINLINIGCIPINIHNVGVYFPKLFNPDKDYFNLIQNEHQFQTLTESNKQSNAFRSGLYLTNIQEQNNELHFNLLRCSSNFSGPTDNFRDTDHEIVNQINCIAEQFYEQKTNFNHVLAQIYENKKIDQIEKKAKIKEHSDKTKDMPKNGLIAFCTFYKDFMNKKFDVNGTSVLTKLRFRLKKTITDSELVKSFDVVLYPNSVFMISLSTNRLYTHEIIPSVLPIDRIPVRMGYVIRCSKTKAVYKDDKTYMYQNDDCVLLEEPTDDKIKELKDLYYQENTTHDMVYYNNFNFSLNKGDYTKPLI